MKAFFTSFALDLAFVLCCAELSYVVVTKEK